MPGEIPGEESDVYAVGRLLAVMLGDDTDGTVRQSGGIRRRNAEKRCGRKEQRQEKWLRKVIAMATCEERKDRIPEIKMLREKDSYFLELNIIFLIVVITMLVGKCRNHLKNVCKSYVPGKGLW